MDEYFEYVRHPFAGAFDLGLKQRFKRFSGAGCEAPLNGRFREYCIGNGEAALAQGIPETCVVVHQVVLPEWAEHVGLIHRFDIGLCDGSRPCMVAKSSSRAKKDCTWCGMPTPSAS